MSFDLIWLIADLFFAVLFTVFAINRFIKDSQKGWKNPLGWAWLVLVVCYLYLSHLHANILGGGILVKDADYFSLAKGSVYTVVSSAPIGNGKFAVILLKLKPGDALKLKSENGKISVVSTYDALRAYELAQDPPKVFVAVDDKENPYVPYPVK